MVAAVVLSGLGAGGAGALATASRAGQPAGHAVVTAGQAAVPGMQLWVRRYNSAGNGYDAAYSVAVSPAGGTVFVTGGNPGISGSGYVTVAYNAATGAQRWVRRYNGPGNGRDRAQSVAVSPAGGTVFVTGDSTGIRSGADYATVAYNAATGARRWITRYNGPANGSDFAQSVAVSPVGGTVFVTGASYRKSNTNPDYATVAYNAATGAQRWVRRYNGPGNGYDYATSVAVSPGGGTVYVTGYSQRTAGSEEPDYATVAYSG
jgi:hypothetical protein